MQAPTDDEVRDLLRDRFGRPDSVREVVGGWVSWTFEVDNTWIVQIPRRTDDIASTHKQASLLPWLTEWVPFRVPVPEVIAQWQERPVVRYRKIPGRAMRAGDDLESLAAMLRSLHSFPVQRASELTGTQAASWHDEYAAFFSQVQTRVLPVLDRDLARAVGAAIDFVGLLITLGPDRAREVVHAYGDGVVWSQVRFYWWLGPVHDVIHGQTVGDSEIVQAGIDGLNRRLMSSAD